MFTQLTRLNLLEVPRGAIIVCVVLISFGLFLLRPVFDKNRKHYPHGPPTLPILGNLHQVPSSRAYLKFTEWSRKYGGMYMLHFGPRKTVVLTDRRLVKELMDKRHAISGNRPQTEILQSMLYKNDDLLLMQPSDVRWRTGRKFLHQNFMATMIEKTHMPLINAEATQVVKDFLLDPENFMAHTKRFGNSFIMSVGYGIRTPDNEAEHLLAIQKVLKNTTLLLQPGTLPPVDIFPFLGWLPQSFFGNWRDKVDTTRREMEALYYRNLDLVVKRKERDERRETYADRLLEQTEQLKLTWREMCFMAGLLMEAGSDTVALTINATIHLLCAYPEWAKKAQEQLDAVVGDDRTPIFADFPQLNIINAIIKESLRMRPISPLGFPHTLTEDAWLDGKLLPKGTDVIVNLFGLQHDETRFEKPDTFNPGRYLHMTGLADEYAHAADPEARDHYAYGVGRRLCPGIHLAERTIFVITAKLLWAFDFQPKLDANGNRVKLDTSTTGGYADGLTVGPIPFECDIKVRSEQKRAAILREFSEAEREIFPKFQAPAELAEK